MKCNITIVFSSMNSQKTPEKISKEGWLIILNIKAECKARVINVEYVCH
jgi:hypothetical protein